MCASTKRETQNELRSADLGQLFCDKLEYIPKKKQQNYSHCHRHKYCNVLLLTGNLQFVCRKKGQKSIVSTGGNGSAQLSDNEREKNKHRNRKWWDIWFTSQNNTTQTTQSSRRACMLYYFVMIAQKNTQKTFSLFAIISSEIRHTITFPLLFDCSADAFYDRVWCDNEAGDKSIGSRSALTLRNEISLSVNCEKKNAFFCRRIRQRATWANEPKTIAWSEFYELKKLNFEVENITKFPPLEREVDTTRIWERTKKKCQKSHKAPEIHY